MSMSEPPDLLRFASDFPPETVLRDYTDEASGLRMLVVRGPLSFCAYVGVRASHLLAELAELRIESKRFNFQDWGAPDTVWPQGWYWWGWDYAHAWDQVDLESSMPDDTPAELRAALLAIQSRPYGDRPRKNWTLGEVAEDALDVLMELKQALTENEKLAALVLAH